MGGPHSIEVVALDLIEVPDPHVDDAVTTEGKLVFRHTFQHDLPQEATTWDIELTREDLRRGR